MKIIGQYANLQDIGKIVPDEKTVCGKTEIICDGDINTIVFETECVFQPYGYTRVFNGEKSYRIELDIPHAAECVAQKLYSPFWAKPEFGRITSNVQYMLMKTGNMHTFILPIVNECFKATLACTEKAGSIEIAVSAVSHDAVRLEGTAAVITSDANPYCAIRKGFEYAINKSLIKNRKKCEKAFPEIFNYLGWCSWNAFGHDVSEEKILGKLSELKKKNIPVKWILIDDGWSETDGFYLKSIYEDKRKFPNGLRHTIEKVKSDYGICSVGIWHSATGYWHGLGFKSKETIETDAGVILPDGYNFFKHWHGYLKACGVDFIKVDCQGNLEEYLKNNYRALEKVRKIQDGLERSASETFDFMLNCMGLSSLNMFGRRDSVIVRSSDDFYPEKSDSLQNHIEQNAYNSLFIDALYYCDFDMWWSEHFQAKQNAVLRAVSGGPFYVSDKQDKSSDEYIRMFVDKSGRIHRFCSAAKPTPDCIYGYEKVLKLFNVNHGGGVVAAFALKGSGVVTISSEDFGGDGEYEVTSAFRNTCVLLKKGERITVEIENGDCELFYFRCI